MAASGDHHDNVYDQDHWSAKGKDHITCVQVRLVNVVNYNAIWTVYCRVGNFWWKETLANKWPQFKGVRRHSVLGSWIDLLCRVMKLKNAIDGKAIQLP